ncbi:MAG TPA: adenylate/guanylate cyclase domain-containing protein [Gaiellaceae bacterium]|nr:adenylate/guanylate cyclase domain-containing protein [Gaiellaceae bacterium]
MVCSSCGHENPSGAKFCAECGSALTLSCPSCGHAYRAGDRFCVECGTALAAAPPPAAAPAAPVAERRLVSVLFADLVGFTPLSETRDPEEVRELLSRYFDTCRRLVELYGGVVEKFIGDAVMAIWGTPVAQEDDAERAVRTALDLVAAVSALGDEVGAPELRARAGVLTGEAAVNLGAVGEGMVAGDLVNTAARIQAAAEPGTVLVGEATRRATEQAVAFEDAGEHELKGKTEPVRLHRAIRVTAARRGAMRSEGLEAPFVGRERELRLVKELYHAAADQSRAQLVQITGIAGIGKSRLTWEFEKYVDGLAENVWWHRGRCLAYGEGVAYWALAEMVRMRAQILEGEEQGAARRKLDACLAEHVPDADERGWIGPRLANLLGLEDRADTDRRDLFAAWRLFFERLTDQGPLVMVFEDLQWADQALLAFVEYLLEWSASQPLYVIALARPELVDAQPDFGRTIRNAASLALEPLGDAEMARLLDGYVPGLPGPLQAQILERAQGVPLYAVETVRMLLDRGLLTQEGPVYRPTGEIGSLEVPETLHALAAARLDGLPPEERRLVQDACVLGKTFTKQALAALTGLDERVVEQQLAGLVRKEVLSLQADPRRPERGQYGFLQELLRQVAYETLSRRDRKARHLAAVAALEATFEGVDFEVPEVIASHLLAAADAAPDDPDTADIRLRARAALVHAGERAAALAAPEEAQRYLDQAAELADGDPAEQAALLERASRVAQQAGHFVDARTRLERALALFESLGDTRAAVRASVGLGDVDVRDGRLEEALARFEDAVAALEQWGPSAELAACLAYLGRMHALRGETAKAGPPLERALAAAETLALPEVWVQALTSKAIVLLAENRLAEARLILEGALATAAAEELHGGWMRASNNLGAVLESADGLSDLLELSERVEEQARRRGDREAFANARFGVLRALFEVGRWDEVAARVAEVEETVVSPWSRAGVVDAVPVFCERGELAGAERLLQIEAWQRDAEQRELAASYLAAEARALRAQGRIRESLEAAERGLAYHARGELPLSLGALKTCIAEATDALFDLGDLEGAGRLQRLLDDLLPGEVTPLLAGLRAVLRARLAVARGGADPSAEFAAAEQAFGAAGLRFRQAVAQAHHGLWLLDSGGGEAAARLLGRARGFFAEVGAAPWLERIDAAERAKVTA